MYISVYIYIYIYIHINLYTWLRTHPIDRYAINCPDACQQRECVYLYLYLYISSYIMNLYICTERERETYLAPHPFRHSVFGPPPKRVSTASQPHRVSQHRGRARRVNPIGVRGLPLALVHRPNSREQ